LTLFWLGGAYVAVPFVLYLLWKQPEGADLRAWFGLLAVLVVLVGLSFFYQKRWAGLAGAVLAIPMAELLGVVIRRAAVWIRPPGKQAVNAVLVVFFCAGFTGVGLVFQASQSVGAAAKAATPQTDGPCRLEKVAGFLSGLPETEARPMRVLSHISLGAELLYRTPLEVVSSGYHRNPEGILDSLAIFQAPADGPARALIRKRKIDLILICPGYFEAALYAPNQGSKGPDKSRTSFYRRLAAGRVPPWLRPLALPADTGSGFLLFQVTAL